MQVARLMGTDLMGFGSASGGCLRVWLRFRGGLQALVKSDSWILGFRTSGWGFQGLVFRALGSISSGFTCGWRFEAFRFEGVGTVGCRCKVHGVGSKLSG